ncbi:hypothetical protein NUBL21980_47380 [Klebsiella michiganensis]|nr:hypothetical protein NUBL21980_47380 [Klebsiella michiganensis]
MPFSDSSGVDADMIVLRKITPHPNPLPKGAREPFSARWQQCAEGLTFSLSFGRGPE